MSEVIVKSYVPQWTTDDRECERRNYIPDPTPSRITRKEWHEAYSVQLSEMYDIVADTIDQMYPRNKVHWYNNIRVANAMSKLLFHCSSKYITEYI